MIYLWKTIDDIDNKQNDNDDDNETFFKQGFCCRHRFVLNNFETKSCCSVLYSIDPRSRKSSYQNKHNTPVEFGYDVQVAFDYYVSCVFASILMNGYNGAATLKLTRTFTIRTHLRDYPEVQPG